MVVDLAFGLALDLAIGLVADLAAVLAVGLVDLDVAVVVLWGVAFGAGEELAEETAMVAKVVKNNDARMEIKIFLGSNTLHSPFSVADTVIGWRASTPRPGLTSSRV
ncbi:MAG TPA: hypothetical protein VIJ77_02640 [Candidatus Tumulicola sp.]